MSETARRLRFGEGADGVVEIDLDELIETRLLVTATSGGGKSGAIYQLCEACSGQVQIVVLDPEGEFAPLRAAFPFVLAGKDGDTPASAATAALLATRVLELGCSVICDFYEMSRRERHEFVRDFVTAMVDAPKDLWHPVLVIVDEAHVFAPEKGQGESVAAQAIEDLATRGRKRGYCVVLATQRLAMLAKTVAANCQNVLVGRTSQVDQVRAAETLQVNGKAAREEFYQTIVRTKTGDFYAHGRAFHTEAPVFFHVDRAQTLPEKKDRLSLQAPPVPAAIRELLPQLANLPQEAAAQAETLETLRGEIRQLKVLQAEWNRKGDSMGVMEEVTALQQRAEAAETRLHEMAPVLEAARAENEQRRAENEQQRATLGALLTLAEQMQELLGRAPGPIAYEPWEAVAAERRRPNGEVQEAAERDKLPAPQAILTADKAEFAGASGEPKAVSGPQQRILEALATRRSVGWAVMTKLWMSIFAGASSTSSSFGNNLGALRSAGMIEYRDGGVALTGVGLGRVEIPPRLTEQAMHERLLGVLPGPQQKIMRVLLARRGAGVGRVELAGLVGAQPTSSSYANNLGALRTLKMLDYTGDKQVVATAGMFLKGRG